MRLLDEFQVPGGTQGRVELLQGDLADPDWRDAADILVVSAFPDDYTPTETSLIGALQARGLSVEELAADKYIDIREDYSCWLSQRLAPSPEHPSYQRVLCFEPLARGRPPEVVADIFRALTPMLTVRPELRSVALPIVATGDQRYGVAEMLRPLLHAAFRWMQVGIRLDRVSIVARNSDTTEEARHVFREARADFEEFMHQQHLEAVQYDAFVSYSHQNMAQEQVLERAVREADPDIRLFVDRSGLETGVDWQQRLQQSIDRSRRVVALLSPQYLASKVCQEEFNAAVARTTSADAGVLFPIYLYSAPIADRFTAVQYHDCREGSEARIRAAALELVSVLHRDRLGA